MAFFGGRFTSLKLGAFFCEFRPTSEVGRTDDFEISSRFWRSFYSPKKRRNKLHLFIRWQAHCRWICSFGRMCLRVLGIQHFQFKNSLLKKPSCQGGFEISPRWVVLKRHPSWKICAKSSNWDFFPQPTTRGMGKSTNLWVATGPGYQFSPARMRSYSERFFASWFRAEFQKKTQAQLWKYLHYIYI